MKYFFRFALLAAALCLTQPAGAQDSCRQSLPYFEDFDSYTTSISTGSSAPSDYPNNTRPNCWSFLGFTSSTSSTAYPKVFLSSYWGYNTGGNALMFTSNGNSPIAVLPPLDTSISYVMLDFAYRTKTANDSPYLTVGYINGTNTGSFFSMTTLPRTTTMTYVRVFFPANLGNQYRIAFRLSGGIQYSPNVSIDDIKVRLVPTCMDPSDVTVGSITSTTAAVGWTPGATTQHDFVVAYGTGTAPDSMAQVNVDINDYGNVDDDGNVNYTLTGLHPNTPYNLYVKAVCGESNESYWSRMASFRTECGYVDIPYYYGFEDATAADYVNGYQDNIYCWARYNDATGTGGKTKWPYAWAGSGDAHTGSKCLYYFCTNGSDYPENQIRMLPQVDTAANPISTLRLKLWARVSNSNASGQLWVGVMSDPTDVSTFVRIQTLYPTTTYTEYTIPLNAYTGNGTYIALKCPRYGNGHHMYVDDISLEALPVCFAPAQLSASAVSETSATLNWVPFHPAQHSFVVAYGTGTDPDSMDTVSVSGNPSVALTGLTRASVYHFYVKTRCSATEETDWSNMGTFQTLCGLPTLPYAEDFERLAPNTLPPCWDNSMSTVVTTHPEHVWNVYESNGNRMLYMGDVFLQNGVAAINMPAIVLPDSSRCELRLDYSHTASNGPLSIKISTDGGSTFSLVDTLGNNHSVGNAIDPMGFSTAVFDLSAYAGDTVTLQFFATTASTSQGAIYLDNIVLRETPDCEEPVNLAIDPYSIRGTRATLSWEPGDTAQHSFAVACGTGTDPDSMVHVNVNGSFSHMLTGLQPNTAYNVYVKAVCGTASQSQWSHPASFVTDCGTLALPYAEDFENAVAGIDNLDSLPCWKKAKNPRINGQTDYNDFYPRVARSEHSRSGIQCLMFYQTDNSYFPEYQMAILPELDTAAYSVTSLQLNFWAKRLGSDNGHLLVGMMSDPYDPATFVAVDSIWPGTTYSEFRVPLAAYAGPATFVAIRCPKFPYRPLNSRTEQIFLDDLVLLTPPACQSPYNLSVANIDATGATLGWLPGNTTQHNFVVAYGTGTDPDSMAHANVNANFTYTFTGLQPNTDYSVYVKAACGASDSSDWSEAVFFRTLPSCIRPSGLMAGAVTSNSATVSWIPSNPSHQNFVVSYGPDSSSMTQVSVSGTSCTLSGLQPRTSYCFFVKTVCSAADQSEWSDTGFFRTQVGCGPGYTSRYGVIGTPDNAHCNNFTYANTSYYQGITSNIFYASEIADLNLYDSDNLLQGLRLYPQDSGTIDLTIFVGHTAKSEFLSASSDTLATAHMARVFDGRVRFDAESWNTITFDTPFAYDADSNLAIVYRRNAPVSSQVDFYYQQHSSYVACHGYRAFSSGNFSRTRNRYRVMTGFVFCSATPSCPPVQQVSVSDIRGTRATLNWQLDDPSEQRFVVAYGTDTSQMAADTVSGTSATLAGLSLQTTYHARVKALCSATDQSSWSGLITFTTHGPAIVVDSANSIIQDFENGMQYWTDLSMNTENAGSRHGITTGNVHGGSHKYCMTSYANAANNDYNQYLVSPEISSRSQLEMTFWYRKYDNDHADSLYVAYSTTTGDIGSMTPWVCISNITGSYQQGTLTFPYGTQYIAFRYNGHYLYDVYLDDIDIHVIPGTEMPDSTVVEHPDIIVDMGAADTVWGTCDPAPGIYMLRYGDTLTFAAVAAQERSLWQGWEFFQRDQYAYSVFDSLLHLTYDTNYAGDTLRVRCAFREQYKHWVYADVVDTALNPCADCGTVTGGNREYYEADTVTLAATAGAGCRFLTWYDPDHDCYCADSVMTFVMGTQALGFYAVFEPDSTGEGIGEIAAADLRITVREEVIEISGAADAEVRLYDVAGRLLQQRRLVESPLCLTAPQSGIYLVQVGNAPARRVVVLR